MVEMSKVDKAKYNQMFTSLFYGHFTVILFIITVAIEGFDITVNTTPCQEFMLFHAFGFLIYDTFLTYFENINIMFIYIHHIMNLIGVVATIIVNLGAIQ